MSNYSKAGAVKLDPAVCAPQSVHNMTLPGGDSSPSPMSFNKKKDGSQGGDLRPMDYRADQKLKGAGA